ncbi:hypothetical protein AB0E01_07025 [Nocardia vinacea]|uniref:hypothetical protein n=1 Tax=Nocardia vinacea TaxID=96468 RepID=UPI0033F5999D
MFIKAIIVTVFATAITASINGIASAEDPLGPNPHGPYDNSSICESKRAETVNARPNGVVGPCMTGDRWDSSYDPNKYYYHILWN